MDVRNRNVLVFGSGISGIGSVRLLSRQGAKVTLFDSDSGKDKSSIKKACGDSVHVDIVTGDLPESFIHGTDIVILSPGVPLDIPVIKEFRENSIPVIGEVELAFQYSEGDVLAITGTNGKTTTTALLGEIMKSYYDDVFVVGNIGNPYTAEAVKIKPSSIVVAELSSFQLETIETFRPKISAILNYTPDHLNRHHTMEEYIRAKENIARNQKEDDYCVLNYEDDRMRSFGGNLICQAVFFSSRRELKRGIYISDNGYIVYKNPDEVMVCSVDDLQILGIHNYENAMTAICMAALYGVPIKTIRRVVREFKGVEHRIEFVKEKDGVFYYNDSKATNTDAGIKALEAMKRPTVLIGGGYDKGADYEEWIRHFQGTVKRLILVGDTRFRIAEEARRCGFDECVIADSFEEAVHEAEHSAVPGDAVLLSPACASWGMFENFEVRGKRFKELVNRL